MIQPTFLHLFLHPFFIPHQYYSLRLAPKSRYSHFPSPAYFVLLRLPIGMIFPKVSSPYFTVLVLGAWRKCLNNLFYFFSYCVWPKCILIYHNPIQCCVTLFLHHYCVMLNLFFCSPPVISHPLCNALTEAFEVLK